MCGSYRDVGASGGLARLVLPLSRMSCNRDAESDRIVLAVRACDGLSWDTPAGFKLLRAVPAVMWQMGIC